MICDIVISNRLDRTFTEKTFTENTEYITWLTVFHIPRPDKKGDRTALFVRTIFSITKNLTPTFTLFERMDNIIDLAKSKSGAPV